VSTVRRRPPRIVLVVACSQRKRLAPPEKLRLASIRSEPSDRPRRWANRLNEVEAPRWRAADLYVGDHWHSACQAYRVAKRYSSRTELWVVSAGYGLIPSSKTIKPYGATFATGAADSVWRGPAEGDRRGGLRLWWRALGHECALIDLLPARGDGAVVVAAGASYLAAIESDLEGALQHSAAFDRLSVISAGTQGNGALLPVSGQFRAAVGGTDSALNARLLALLASEAGTHGFRRSAMAAMLTQMASRLPATPRRTGRATSDEQIVREIQAMRRRLPEIGRTRALRDLRSGGIACEQGRFASIWNRAEPGP
jgi:hypothetical protein